MGEESPVPFSKVVLKRVIRAGTCPLVQVDSIHAQDLTLTRRTAPAILRRNGSFDLTESRKTAAAQPARLDQRTYKFEHRTYAYAVFRGYVPEPGTDALVAGEDAL